MRVLVVGAGAVGGYVAALLRRSERDVTVVARGARADAIRKHGIRLRSATHGDFVVEPGVVTSVAEAAELGGFDVILVAVKSPDLDRVADELQAWPRLLTSQGLAISLLNQLDSEQILGARLGSERVAGGVVYAGLEGISLNEVLHTTGGEILIGPFDPSHADHTRAAAEFLVASGIPGGYRDDLVRIRWRKMIWNCAYNPITALTDTTVAEATNSAALRPLLEAAMRETMAVAAAAGFRFHESVLVGILKNGATQANSRPSMSQDLRSGRVTEHQTMNGAVARMGRALGVATPVNDLLLALLEGRHEAAAKRNPGTPGGAG